MLKPLIGSPDVRDACVDFPCSAVPRFLTWRDCAAKCPVVKAVAVRGGSPRTIKVGWVPFRYYRWTSRWCHRGRMVSGSVLPLGEMTTTFRWHDRLPCKVRGIFETGELPSLFGTLGCQFLQAHWYATVLPWHGDGVFPFASSLNYYCCFGLLWRFGDVHKK